jgi:hypothetical protein
VSFPHTQVPFTCFAVAFLHHSLISAEKLRSDTLVVFITSLPWCLSGLAHLYVVDSLA